MSVIRVLQKFLSVLSRHQKLRMIELAILMLIGGILEMFSVSLVLPFMNVVMNPDKTMEKWYARFLCKLLDINSTQDFLIMLAVGLAFIYLLKNAYLIFEFNIQYRFVYGNMFAMQRKLLDNYIHRPYEYFLKVDSGEIVRIINNDAPQTFELLSTLISLFTELVVSSMLIGTIFFITPITTICMAVVLVLLLLIISKVIKPVLQRAGIQNQKSSAGMNKWLLQSIQGIKELKIMGKEEYFQENFDENGRGFVDAIRKAKTLSITPRFIIEAISMSTMFIIVAIMIYSGGQLENIVPMLTAVAMAAIRLLPSTNRISNGIATIAYNEPMLDKMIENVRTLNDGNDVNIGTRLDKHSYDYMSNGFIKAVNKNIEFSKITFHYPGSENNVISDTSFEIMKGESIGIVGNSGAGKTTLVDIILGLLKPQSGQVFVDGLDIEHDMKGWHNCVGYIPQMIFMLDDSIRNNVCFGIDEKDIDEERLWMTLRDASLYEFVNNLPEGVNTQIGERGVRLSGGQRQRIGIARALYRNPSVLVFDEATSALDNDTEMAIMDSIHSLHGNKTMIIIAHRLSTIEACDHIYRVDNEKVIKER